MLNELNFNDYLLNEVDLSSNIIFQYVKEHPEDDIIFNICRETYLLSFNAEIVKGDDGSINQLIKEEDIKPYVRSLDKVVEVVQSANGYTYEETKKDLLLLIEKHYIKTALPDEVEQKSFTVAPDKEQHNLHGTYYNTNRIPDWNNFVIYIENLNT